MAKLWRGRSLSDVSAAVVSACSCVAFVVLATRELRLPGVYYDELFEVVPSLAFVKGGLPSAVSEIQKSVISVFGHPLALMAQPYNGGLKTIVFIPVAAVFGITAASVRWFTITTSLVALIIYCLFARQLFRSGAAAAVAACLVAFDSAYIFFSRVDYGPSTLMFLLKAVALWQLTLWWRARQARSLALGCFALGLGVYDKTNFLWVVGAIVLAAAIVSPRQVRERVSRRTAPVALAAFIAGALPLLIYNLSWPPRTLAPIRAGTVHLRYGNYKGNVFEQFAQRCRELANLMDGATATSFFGYERFLVVAVLPLLAAAAAAIVLVLFARRSSRAEARPAAFVALTGLIILVEAALTPGGDKPHHVLLAYPLPHILVAGVTAAILRYVRQRISVKSAAVVAVTFALVLVQPAVGCMQTLHILDRLRSTGGLGNYSDAIYRLEDYLSGRDHDRTIVFLDWGMFYPIVGLSQGDLRCVQLWRDLNTAAQPTPALARQLTNPAFRYVVHVPGATNFPRPREHFFAVIRSAGLRAERERVIDTRRGKPLFVVYRLVHS